VTRVAMTVNGVEREADVEPRTLLVDLIRDGLGLTGTKIGCDTSQCGACTIDLDGSAVKSCTLLAVQADGSSITTIEGVTSNGELHPVQQAFWEHHGLQCGFCTPGMVMTAIDLIRHADGDLSDEDIRRGLEGNLCRCTGYENIVRAIRAAAANPVAVS
jgi:carbon-monoxide dehydrogenase small subunit